jgi:mono/diheme cytochrome c family protein
VTLPKAGDWSLTIESGFQGVGKLELQPLKALERNARQLPIAVTERGQQLFVAKGCVTCHSVEGKSLPAPFVQGPRLVPHKYRGEYLAVVLANPALMPPAANVGFRMPNLDLEPREIDALVAFLNPVTPAAGSVGQK